MADIFAFQRFYFSEKGNNLVAEKFSCRRDSESSEWESGILSKDQQVPFHSHILL
jgi:hypothetical protein